MVLLEVLVSAPQYRQLAAAVLACTLAMVLSRLYRFAGSRGKQREYVFPGVAPGPDGYRKGQQRYLTECAAMIQEGIQMLGENTVFWVPSMVGPVMVAPRRYLPEIKSHPDLSFAAYLREALCGAQTGADGPFWSQRFVLVIKKNLTQSLSHVTAALSEEAVVALDRQLPSTEEWTAHKVHPVLQQLFARVNSRVFLGEPLCRRQRWLDIAASYATYVMAAGMELRRTGRLAPLAQWWLPSCAALRRSVREADAMIMAVVRERRAQQQTLGAAYVKPNDALQWTIDQGESDATLAQFQLGFAFSGIHTATVTMTHLLYDLCLYPEYVDVLRRELHDLLGGRGFNASSDVQKLWKMDSFMKESQRLHPVQGAALARRATKDIRLSDGTQILAGERLHVASSTVLRDARFYRDPETFDGLRFYKLRQQPGQENSHQYVSSSDTFLAFGHGAHFCPGRFFAAAAMKIILAHMLMRYDFRFPDGQKDRPASVPFEEVNSPDPRQEILFRRRRD